MHRKHDSSAAAVGLTSSLFVIAFPFGIGPAAAEVKQGIKRFVFCVSPGFSNPLMQRMVLFSSFFPWRATTNGESSYNCEETGCEAHDQV